MDKSNKRIVITLVSVFILFAALVPIYWATSNGRPDGLDTLLEQRNVKEGSVYSPPLAELQNYGSTMPLYILSGIVGAIIVLGVLLLVGKIAKRNRREDKP